MSSKTESTGEEILQLNTGGGSPTGSAGGALDGTYPNPGLAASVAGAGLAESSDVLSVNVDTTSIAISADTLQRTALTGDATASAGSSALTLATVNANVGSFGSATQVAAQTVNAKGLTTAASNVTIAIPSTAVTDFTEAAQDATGAMVDASLTYVDGTPLLQRAALTGDVTASAGANATTIANDAVSYAKMQNVSAATRLLGRGSASGAGDPEELTVSTGLSLSGTALSSTITQYTDENAQDAVGGMVDASLTYVDATPLLQRAALTGDVTASAGANATTIAADAVTYAKMQNASAGFVVLGKTATGSGDYAEIAAGTDTVLGRVVSGNLAFAKLELSQQANLSASRIVGRDSSAAGVPQALTLPTGFAITSGAITVAGRLMSMQFFTTGTGATYTRPAGIGAIEVFQQGAGGGGGGVDATGTAVGAGGGGGAGGTNYKYYASAAATYTYSVGAGGAGATAGANNGTDGGATTFDNGGTMVTATGGQGGFGDTASTSLHPTAGGNGGVAGTNGDINGSGAPGFPGIVFSSTSGISGTGGSSACAGLAGRGGTARAVGATAGNGGHGIGGDNYGAGGAGGLAGSASSVDRTGGAGTGGFILVKEYAS